MILCFSSTGNSRFVAEKIAKKTNDDIINLNDKIKNNDYSSVSTDSRLVIVTPTYAWRIPRIVTEWIEKTKISGVNGVWFVMTCGGEVGNAEKYNKLLCEKKSFEYKGTAQIVMPENYIAMFDAPQVDEARKIVNKALSDIDKAIDCILNNQPLSKISISFKDKILSGIVNDVFYPVCVKSNDFYATDSCVSCGKCVKLCPLNNIESVNGKPVWHNNCTHCMACICYCPVEAIEYGNKSKGKPRYHIENL